LNTFIAESIANTRMDEINDNFVEWMSDRFREFTGDAAALEELGDSIPALSNVESETDARQLTNHLNEFLSQLDPDSRYIFVRRYWHGDSVTTIAQQTNTSPHAVSVRLYRIRHKLQKYLQKEGFET